MSFPASAPRQLLGTHSLFQVAPPLVSLCFAVVSCSWFYLVCFALLCPVQILYPCDHQYPVEYHGGLSAVLGFSTAGIPAVRFSVSLISFRFYDWIITMDSVRVLLAVTSFSTVSFFWTDPLDRVSREATICSPIRVSVSLLSWILKSPPLVSFWMSRFLPKAAVHFSFHFFHVYWLAGVWRLLRHAGTRFLHWMACLVPVMTIVASEMGEFASDAKSWHFSRLRW